MNEFKQAIATLLDVIEDMIDSRIKKIKCDRTFKGKVTEVINPKKYKVSNEGKAYTVSSSIPCIVGEWVWVCAPKGNWNDLFVVSKW